MRDRKSRAHARISIGFPISPKSTGLIGERSQFELSHDFGGALQQEVIRLFRAIGPPRACGSSIRLEPTHDRNVVFPMCPLKRTSRRLDVWRESSNVCGTRAGAGNMKKGSRPERDPQKLALQLDRLRELTPEELRERWQTLFGADPPPKLRSSLQFKRLHIGFKRKPLGASSLQPCGCWSESQTMPRYTDRFPRLPKRFA
jgi:hypothetical protein